MHYKHEGWTPSVVIAMVGIVLCGVMAQFAAGLVGYQLGRKAEPSACVMDDDAPMRVPCTYTDRSPVGCQLVTVRAGGQVSAVACKSGE